jgi:hypothetical protein
LAGQYQQESESRNSRHRPRETDPATHYFELNKNFR